MTHRVVFAPEAQDDIDRLFAYIVEQAGTARGLAYLARIEACCLGLRDFPQRGARRDDLWPGLRIVGFERRVTIAFVAAARQVTNPRIL